ncbi:MAG TPA: hypothetical protein VIU61_27510, partial [Kofleriaceae bacterium]
MTPPLIDIGILTIRDDEFRAVLGMFPDEVGSGIHRGGTREYSLRYASAGKGGRYTLAIVRQPEHGNGEAQDAARDMLEDLDPGLLLVVGIAGGLPSDDITLGDVVLSTRIHDYSVEARKARSKPTYAMTGGPIAKKIVTGLANLAAREKDLGDWTESLPPRPRVAWNRKGQLFGSVKWQRELKDKLEGHFGKTAIARAPIFMTGPIASSDRLVRDPRVLFPWIETARNLLAIEMESGGAYRAARERCPMLAIRAISDIVGLERSNAWTGYAAESAAAFTHAYLKTRPVPLRGTDRSAKTGVAAPKDAAPEPETDVLYSNLIPVTAVPPRIWNAPATVKTYKQAWAILKKGKFKGHIPRSWILHNNNIYSFTDPEDSRLSRIVDTGAIESNPSDGWAAAADGDQVRLFVQLLNGALRDDLGPKGVRHFHDDDVFAFVGCPDEEPRTYRYQNIRHRSAITVVSHYESENAKGRKFRVLRHLGFSYRFRRIHEDYVLEITPTYRFTTDGWEKDRFHDQKLSGIKRLERNRSVLSQVRLWNDLLSAPLADRPQLLTFGSAFSFEVVQRPEDEIVTFDEYESGENDESDG